MDERIDGIMTYEREATAARDEAIKHRSYANSLRRGDLQHAAEQRDSWGRSRVAWSNDAQEHLMKADELDAQAKAWERTPLQLLRAAPPALFAMYRQRRADHRHAQRGFIVANPGVIPDPRLRITWESRLLLAEPAIDVAAYVDRTVRELAASTSDATPARGKGKGGKTTVTVARGDVYNPDAPQSSLRGLDPWNDDQRSAQEVIAAQTPTGLLTLSKDPDKPHL
jgi:hypothetical protein